MVQFIHLCLLLGLSYSHVAATCPQLVTLTDLDNITQQRRSCLTQDCAETPTRCKNVATSSNDPCCKIYNQGCPVCLNVTNDCIQLFNANFLNDQTKDWMKDCIDNQNCQYFAFNKRDNTFSENCCINANGLQFHLEAKSWIDALAYCRTNGSSLVQITNTTVQTTVNQLLKLTGDLQKGVWIGLERSIFGCDSSWKWVSGENVQNPPWSSRFPVNATNNFCGKIIGDDKQTYMWQDENCFGQLPFICQGPA